MQSAHRIYVARQESNENGPSNAEGLTILDLTDSGDFASKPATALDLLGRSVEWEPEVVRDPPVRPNLMSDTLGFMFTGGAAANKTFSWKLYAWRNENGPAQYVATGTGILGTQALVKYPHNGEAATNKFWADTLAITWSNWSKEIGVSDTVGHESVAQLYVGNAGYRYWYLEVADADGSTGTEAGGVTIWNCYWKEPVNKRMGITSASGNDVVISDDGEMWVQQKGKVDENNSTVTPLAGDTGGADHIYTGTATDILDCGIAFVNISTDVASATDGLSMQQSSDGTNWDHTDDYTIAANANKNFSINPHSKYFRVVYTNGIAAQNHFRLQTICKMNSKASSHRIKDNIIGDDDCSLVKAAITGLNGDGDWHNVKTTADGFLTVVDQSNGLSIAEGNVTGKSFIHKFGQAPDFDQADGFVTIWDGANDSLYAGSPPMVYTYSATADIGTISSSNNGDTQTVEVQGLDTNYDVVTQEVILTGQTDALLGTDLIRVFRLKNVGATDIAGVVYIRTNGSAQVAGVPSVAASVRAIINNGNNQTLMAVYTVPNGKTAYMRDWYSALAGASRTSNYIIHLKARPFGQAFQLKHVSALSESGTSHVQHTYTEPEIFQAKTDIELRVSATATAITSADIAGGFDIVLVDD